MSVAASTSSPGRSASFSPRLWAITRWFAWKSDSISCQSAPISASAGAALRMTSRTPAILSLLTRTLRARSRS